MTAYDLLVVGAGITGLAAAWEASEAGASVLVLDPAQQVGGKVSTERVDGLVIERGPDAFVAYRPAALDLVDELGLGGEVVGVGPDRTVHIRSGGRLRPIPEGMGLGVPTRLGPFLRTHLLSPWDKARAALDLLLPRRLPDEDVAVGPFLRARLGNGVVDRLAQPLVGGVYGAGLDELSLDAVLPNLREDERGHRSLLLAGLSQGRARRAAAGTPSDSAPGATSPFRSLRRGLGSLPEALQAALLERGATVRLGTAPAALEAGPSGTTVRYGALSAERVGAVVLAAGADPSAELLAGRAPHAAAALREIPHGSSTVVTLAWAADAFDEPPVSHGWLEADPAPVSGVTVSSAKWPGRAPAGVVLLRAFVPERIATLATAPDDVVATAVSDHVAAVLGAHRPPRLRRVTRWRGVMPRYAVGHLDRVARVEAGLVPQPTWRVAGAALNGVGIPDCIADGRRAARLALGTERREMADTRRESE
ncbi:MAG: protoporphyrinogen oxidase [Dermatophilaceae bacterium]